MHAEVDGVHRWRSTSRVPCDVKDEISDFALHALRDRTDISAIALFGSYARGTARGAISDVDLLVVTESHADSRTLRARIRSNCMDVSPVFRTAHDLRALAVADWSFVEHLKREHETVVDVRGVLPKLLSPLQPDRAQVREEILDHAAKLDQFEDLEVFAGQHLTSYSTLYSTAKSVAILDGIANGEPAFDRNAALDGWIARRPAAAELAHSIRALEPFFLRLRRRSEVSLPWTPVDDEPRLQRTVDLVRRFIRETS